MLYRRINGGFSNQHGRLNHKGVNNGNGTWTITREYARPGAEPSIFTISDAQARKNCKDYIPDAQSQVYDDIMFNLEPQK